MCRVEDLVGESGGVWDVSDGWLVCISVCICVYIGLDCVYRCVYRLCEEVYIVRLICTCVAVVRGGGRGMGRCVLMW